MDLAHGSGDWEVLACGAGRWQGPRHHPVAEGRDGRARDSDSEWPGGAQCDTQPPQRTMSALQTADPQDSATSSPFPARLPEDQVPNA